MREAIEQIKEIVNRETEAWDTQNASCSDSLPVDPHQLSWAKVNKV